MDFGHLLVAGTAIILCAGAPIVLLALVLWYKSRKSRLMHETAMRLVEKGQPVPAEFFSGANEPFSDLRRGVVLISLGLGIALFMYELGKPWSVGLIPLFMGAGYLVVWRLESSRPRDAN